MPSDPERIDEWMEERTKHEIYDEPLASDGDFFEYWHTPAQKLGLRMISNIYQDGITIKSKTEIKEFLNELNILLNYLNSKNSSDEMGRLNERIGNAIEAANIAMQKDGWIVI